VADGEGASLQFVDFDEFVLFVDLEDDLGEVLVGRVQVRGLVDEMEEAHWLLGFEELEEIDDGFVVLETDIVGEFFEAFPQKLVLFFFEDIGDVELLQFLIGKIDEKLFQGVDLEHFEAKDIKQSDTPSEFFGGLLKIDLFDFDLLVEFDHQVVKGLLVEIFGEGVLEGDGFFVLQRRVDDVHANFPCFEAEALFQTFLVELQQFGHIVQKLFVGDDCCLFIALGKFLLEGEVAEVEDRCDDGEDAIGFCL
jgi:hypothetical protein